MKLLRKISRQTPIAFLCVTLAFFTVSTPSVHAAPTYNYSMTYADGQSVALTADLTVTLTAQYAANATQTVTYSLNGGTGTLPTHIPVSRGAPLGLP